MWNVAFSFFILLIVKVDVYIAGAGLFAIVLFLLNTETEIICENQDGVIDCGENLISISSSVYGRTDASTCGLSYTTDCVLDVAPELAFCNGQSQCTVEAENDLSGDPCSGTRKYLNITYTCEDSLCETDWVYNDGNCYLFEESGKSWDSAREYCSGFGADLASIHSEDENSFILGSIESHSWIGITDVESEGVYTTFSDGTPIDFENFAANSHQDESRDCVKIKSPHGEWTWKGCLSSHHSVCKKAHAVNSTLHPVTSPHATTTHLASTTVPPTSTSATTTVHETSTIHARTTTASTTGKATTQPSTTISASSESAHVVPTIEPSFIIVELIMYSNYESSLDNIFQVNDTILVIASIFGPFQPFSAQIIWSITDHLSGESIEHTVYSEDAVLVNFPVSSLFAINAIAVGTTHNLTSTVNATVLPTINILCPAHIYAGREVWCALLTDDIVEYSNYTFCFDGSACSTANPTYWSLADIPDPLIDRTSSMEGLFASFQNHLYSEIGSRTITAEIFQILAFSVQVDVIEKPECIRKLGFVNGKGNSTHPAGFLRASDIGISANMELDEECNDPMTSDFKWWIFTSDENDVAVIAFEKITHIPQVTIPQGTLPYGIHSLNLKVEMNHRTSGEVTGEEQIITWLEILPSPLVAVIKGGASRSHGVSSSLIVDGSTSYDPDVTDGSSSDLTFVWYCVMVDGETMYLSMDEAMQNTDDACFEDEEILENSHSSKVEIMSSILKANVTLNFWLIVSKEGRASGSSQQSILLTPGLLPEIEIE
ncbi:sperm receptor for egg jelly-like [Lytechinus variegatus]|uniref:sperm receptor for egg jelly-like n=1 Tax=Lytechinus variegatus TaxID=7654 RepID=UPI001BB1E403|nr:sperm receptor for egg jelly-like [Lytechinus variegatus]